MSFHFPRHSSRFPQLSLGIPGRILVTIRIVTHSWQSDKPNYMAIYIYTYICMVNHCHHTHGSKKPLPPNVPWSPQGSTDTFWRFAAEATRRHWAPSPWRPSSTDLCGTTRSCSWRPWRGRIRRCTMEGIPKPLGKLHEKKYMGWTLTGGTPNFRIKT